MGKNHNICIRLCTIVTVLLALLSCNKEIYDQPIYQGKSKSRILSGEDVKFVKQKLNSLLNSEYHIEDGRVAREGSLFTIKYEEIFEVIDSLGNINYTFRVDHPDSGDLKFFNLVLQEKSGGNLVKLVEYSMTEEFGELFKRTFDLTHFRGTIKSEVLLNTTDCPDPIYIIDIGQIDENPGQGGGGSGGSDPDTTIPPNPNPEPNDLVIVFFPSFNPEDYWDEVSQTPRYFRLAIGIEESDELDDCVKEVFGVLHPINSCGREFLFSTTSQEREYLLSHKGDLDRLQALTTEFASCEEAKVLINQLLDELVAGAIIDWDNRIILSPTFLLNQKAVCVYDKMRNINGFNKALSQFGGAYPMTFLRFNAGAVPGDGRAVTDAPDNFNIISITVNNSSFSENGINYQPNTLLAQTLIHEVLHAEFYRQIMYAIGIGSYVEDPEVVRNALQTSQYPILAHYFEIGYDWQHNYMAERFRRAIARVTQQFHTNTIVPDDAIPDPLFTSLAWRGLDNLSVPAWVELAGSDPNNLSEAAQAIRQTIEDFTLSNANQICQ